jgi:hypothetical protein
MATARQVRANQINALRSKGPVTEEGKRASRANSLKHGLSGAGVVLPAEETALVRDRLARWAPEGGRGTRTAIGSSRGWSSRRCASARRAGRSAPRDRPRPLLTPPLAPFDPHPRSFRTDRARPARPSRRAALSHPVVAGRRRETNPLVFWGRWPVSDDGPHAGTSREVIAGAIGAS